MEKFRWSIIAVVIILITFGFYWVLNWQKSKKIVEIVAKPDKTNYISNEEMQVKIQIKSNKDIKSVEIKISGIEDKLGNKNISDQKTIDLKAYQTQEIEFKTKLPECNSCSGLDPGKYEIVIQAIQDSKILGENKFEINLSDK